MNGIKGALLSPRLVILAHYGGPYAGTFISMVRALAREARIREWEAEVILSSAARGRPWLDDLEKDGIPYRFAPDVGVIALQRWLSNCIIDDSRPFLLHSHFTKYDLPAAFASCGRPNVTVFWHIHSYTRPLLCVRARNVIKYALIGRFIARIFCVAPNIVQTVLRRGGSHERVVCIPNAIDCGRFPLTTPHERGVARDRLGLLSDVPVLLHFGWDWEIKGGDAFVRVVAALKDAGFPVIGLTVSGGEPAKASALEFGIEDRIRVLEPTSDVGTLYSAADVFIASSIAEGMPFSVVEALCTGLAVVGSDIPGHAVIAENIEACRLTPLDLQALTSAVCNMLGRDPATVASQGAAARAEVCRRLDLPQWAERMVDNYVNFRRKS